MAIRDVIATLRVCATVLAVALLAAALTLLLLARLADVPIG